MPMTVTTDLVAVARDVTDQLRKAFGHPTQHEERRADSGPVQQAQQPIRVLLDATGKRRPIARRDPIRERRDLKIVFDVNRHCVDGSSWIHDADGLRMFS